MSNSLQKKIKERHVYIVTRGTSRNVYSNIKAVSVHEKLNYWRVYRSLRSRGVYSEENVFIENKIILK